MKMNVSNRISIRLLFLLMFVGLALALVVPEAKPPAPPNNPSCWNRRDALLLVGAPLLVAASSTVLPESANAASSSLFLSQPQPQGITTVILDSATVKLGVKLEDAILGTAQKSYPVVHAVSPDGPAKAQGVVPGMVVLGQPSAKALVQRLQRGPYPFAVQFYDLSFEFDGDETTTTASTALERAKDEAKRSREAPKEPALSAKGTGLVVKTTRKATTSDCTLKARRGDTVTILYEARVASPGGPIYDSTAERGGEPVTFQLGDGKAIAGVDIGLGGMCQGEVREIDIPNGLGYGRFGSQVFDVPGDVRLWWRVELLELVEGEKRFPFR
jgi:FKBP-type peptidyl-prolyl cis-trans isomerase